MAEGKALIMEMKDHLVSSSRMLLVGEPMGLLIAQNEGPLDAVDGYSLAVAGAEYNVAVGMTRLGHSVDYMTKLGDDPFGRRIVHSMQQNGINTDMTVWSKEQPTGFMLKSKVIQGDPQVFYFRKDSAASAIGSGDISTIDLSRYSHIHVTGILAALSPTCLAAAETLMRRGREAGLTVSFDPNLRPTLWKSRETMITEINRLAALACIVLPGIGEGEILMGSRDPGRIADFYLGQGVGTVVVKLGAQGAYAKTSDSEMTVEGFKVEKIVDTVGAGDGFAVGVLSALMEGRSIKEALRRGNAIGAIQLTHAGDNEGLPARPELTAFMEHAK